MGGCAVKALGTRKLALSPSRKVAIRRLTSGLLKEVSYESGAVPIERIAIQLGAVVKYAPYEGELAGMLIQNGKSSIIAVNSSHHKNRQRFTIAHECGHLCLHGKRTFVDEGFSIWNRDENSSYADDILEVEANQFSADILMPAKNIIRDLDRFNVDLEDSEQISRMAKFYSVSAQALSYRIANLISF